MTSNSDPTGLLPPLPGIYGGGPIYKDSSVTIPNLASSGFAEVIVWNIAVTGKGDLNFNYEFPLVSDGKYIGDKTHPDFVSNMSSLKSTVSSVKRLTFSIGSSNFGVFQEIKKLVNSKGTGPTSTLYKNFHALRTAIPEVDCIDFDDENCYDTDSMVDFAVMLGEIGFSVSFCPFTNAEFWKGVADRVNTQRPGTVIAVHLQCYSGGASNSPCNNWDFGDIPVYPGLASSDDSPDTVKDKMSAWHKQCGITGGFIWIYDKFYTVPDKAQKYASAIETAVETKLSVDLVETTLNFDHIVVVVMENHSYEEVIRSSCAPYINQLATEGLLIDNAYGEEHPSQPNYFWLFSGSNQGWSSDGPYWLPGKPRPVFDAHNLYTALVSRFSSKSPSDVFGGYVDSGTSAPVADYYHDTLNYANRHVPWLAFKNINGGKPKAITRDFSSQFPSGPQADFESLPIVSFVIPALNHDMHDYDNFGSGVSSQKTSKIAVSHGDTWLKDNLKAYADWAKKNNSLLILTWDEDSSSDWITPTFWGGGGSFTNPSGLTAPDLGPNPGVVVNGKPTTTSGPNHIPMIFYGANLAQTGSYKVSGAGVNNINLLRTIEAVYGLKKSGAQTSLASSAGLTDDAIPNIFTFSD